MDEIKIASEMRHDIIHGVATFHPEGATQIEMVRILRDAERGSAKHFTVTAIQVLESAVSVNKLAGRMFELFNLLNSITKAQKTD